MRHTQSRFPFPRVRPSFTRESLRGWWDGVVGREGQQQHRATTPTATPPLSRTLCGLRSHLEPNAVARPAGETVRHNRRTTTTHNRPGQRNRQQQQKQRRQKRRQQRQDNGQRSNRSRARQQRKARAAEQERQKKRQLQHSKRQCRSGRPAASAAGRDRHPPRRVLHTPSGKASAAARVARRPHLHSAHLRAE